MPLNVMPRKYLTVAMAVAAIVGFPSAGLGQSDQVTQAGSARNGVRLGAPAGTYIAARLKSADLDGDRAVTVEDQGKKIRFMPARPTDKLEDAAQGHVLGVLE